ncbi:podocalyxin isoform X1 [Gopherus evgoodei]|uniref:podocalyxin isoform X1 n=1 Tax=Gopherus evgoodei TaxID=1825980 RepID=UPI0011CF2008|nr:podocalyxin isoform X1 [Gopherus evgoodei]
MRCPLLLLVLLCCREGAIEKNGVTAASITSAPSADASSQGSQPPAETMGAPPPTQTVTSTKADISPSAGTGILPAPSTSTNTLSGASTLPPPTSGTPGSVSAPSSTDAGTSLGTGTPPPAGAPSHTNSSTLPPADTGTSPTRASAASEGMAVVVSTTTDSADSFTVGAPTAAPVDHALSAAATRSSVATPDAPAAVTPSSTIAADVPSSADTGPAAVSPSQKPQTPETTTGSSLGVNTDKEHTTWNQPVKPVVATESATKPREAAVATTQQAGVVSQPPASSSGTVISITASTSLSRHTPAPGREPKPSDSPPQNKILCKDQNLSSDSAIILTLKDPIHCGSPVDPSLHNMLCKAVKATFNRSRDICTVRLAAAGKPSNKIAVLGVSVQTNAAPKELFELLGMKKAELRQLGIGNVTYADKQMEDENEDRFSMPLIITIVCMACSLLLVAAIYGCCHQRVARRKDQQRLTEELQTMENGYHDNPTLEVMETSSEMQEKKVNLNGELGDSWIVPMDNLTKEELEGEEDTHL